MTKDSTGGLMRPRTIPVLALVVAIVTAVLAGCGGGSSNNSQSSKPVNPNAAEKSPPGDIPDNQAFVRYSPPSGGYTVKVPEGWARTAAGKAIVFTDKLNSVSMESAPAAAAPTASAVRATDLPQLARANNSFKAGKVTAVHRPAGTAVLVTYLANSKPNAVTGKVAREAVERYVFFHNGKKVILTLSGAKGADNVDPWRTVTDSLRWTG
jgi:hypothetical protein